MIKKLTLIGLLIGLASPAFASGGGFTVAHALLGWLEEPLLALGVDPLPMLDMVIVAALVIVFAYFGGKPFRKNEMLEPVEQSAFAHFAEVVVTGILSFLSSVIKHGIGPRPLMPLLGTYAIFILCLNLIGLVPGFNPPTDQFNVTIAFAIIIFVVTHALGIHAHGGHYVKQFMGPMVLLAPLMIPIELISHCVRPLSLSIRLFGNMTGDHKVVLVFFSIMAIGLPIPFMALGILVSVLQAFVFVVLSAIYFEGALGEAH